MFGKGNEDVSQFQNLQSTVLGSLCVVSLCLNGQRERDGTTVDCTPPALNLFHNVRL